MSRHKKNQRKRRITPKRKTTSRQAQSKSGNYIKRRIRLKWIAGIGGIGALCIFFLNAQNAFTQPEGIGSNNIVKILTVLSGLFSILAVICLTLWSADAKKFKKIGWNRIASLVESHPKLLILGVLFLIISGIFNITNYIIGPDKKIEKVYFSETNKKQPTFSERIERVIHPISGTTISTLVFEFAEIFYAEATYSEAGEVIQPKVFFFGIPFSSFFQLNIDDGSYYADVSVYGISVIDHHLTNSLMARIRIIRNKWVKFPPEWQVNSNDIALEVVDEYLQPVFQLIRRSESHIAIYGVFMTDNLIIFAGDNKFLIYDLETQGLIQFLELHPVTRTAKTGIADFRIQRIFRYPTEGNEGKINPKSRDKLYRVSRTQVWLPAGHSIHFGDSPEADSIAIDKN